MIKKLEVCENTYYVGGSDRRLALFENIYPLTNGASYNSYLILDEKTCLIGGVDSSVIDFSLKRIKETLDGKDLDYFVIQHMEPDHSASIVKLINLYPKVTIVLSQKALDMLRNFNEGLLVENIMTVKEFDKLNLGKHILTFINTPMVHWPEVIMTYDMYTKTLFSADAFGTFGALSGNLFAERSSFEKYYEDEARRYYTNIVGKYGPQVLSALDKASTIDIANIFPLHGPLWNKDLTYILNLYTKWASYTPEVEGALIVYGSVYGSSEIAANLIADDLALLGVKNIAMYDASKTDKSYLVAEAFKYSHLIVVSSTYNMGIFTPVEEFLLDLKYHNLQNRKFSVVENGSWAPNSGKLIIDILSNLKGFEMIGEKVTFKSSVKKENAEQLDNLSRLIADTIKTEKPTSNPLFNLTYGLFVLSSKLGEKQNGCIINTVTQVASMPDRIMFCVNKNNYSADIIKETKKCNISVLTESATFALFKRFGFQSGRDVNKFDGFNDYAIANNGIAYITKSSNAYFSLKVIDIIDLGTHYGFIATIDDSKVLSNEKSVTYSYYMNYIKPAVKKDTSKKTGWICKICGYIYEGENLPADFICPICKHGASDFERIK